MHLLTVKGLEIGKTPRVVGTLTSRAGLEAFPREGIARCDIAEVRLDEIGLYPGWQDACRAIETAGTPVLLTLRSADEGGKCALSNPERREILRQGLGSVSLLDVELASNLAASLAAEVKAAGKGLIVSYHRFTDTPPREELEAVIGQAAVHASIIKVAAMVQGEDDLLNLQTVLANRKAEVPLCLIGMGARGTTTRTSFPALGSCLTYGFLDSVCAPGQISAGELVRHLRSALPHYDEEFARRHGAAASA